MSYLLRALKHTILVSDTPKLPVSWSEAGKQYLGDVSSQAIVTAARVDAELAPSLLKCADGQFADAESEILMLLHREINLIGRDVETFISFLYAAIIVQRFDIASALLRDRYEFGRDREIDTQQDDPGKRRVRWDVLPPGAHRFTFDAGILQIDNTRLEVLVFQWESPVYANYSYTDEQTVGSVVINQSDIGQTPGLAWSESRPKLFLIPDCVFVPSKGHSYIRDVVARNDVPWEARKPIAFWRGGTAGVPSEPGNWRTLERVRLCELCEIARRYEHTGLIDAGLSSIKQIGNPTAISEIDASGLIRGYVPWEDWSQYKYLIEIDGNCNSWSNRFQRLLTASPVLRVESA